MKNAFSAIRLTILSLLFFSLMYPLVVWAIAQAAPHAGRGKTVEYQGRTAGFENIGQTFNNDSLFWSRPSAVAYNAAASGGSNKGPNNPDFLKTVEERVALVLQKHTYLNREDIPADLVTASGSGLDPDISPQSAQIQVRRVAKVRGLDEKKVSDLVAKHTEQPLLGLFGPARVNVLKLNLALIQV